MPEHNPQLSIFDRLQAEGVPAMQPNPERVDAAIARLRRKQAEHEAQPCTCPCCAKLREADNAQ